MIKVLVALLCVALASAQVSDYAVDVTGYMIQDTTKQSLLPSYTSDNSVYSCSTAGSTTQYYYVNITANFATAGVRTVQVLGYSSYYYLSVYQGAFNPTNPCANIVAQYDYTFNTYGNEDNLDDLQISTAYYLQAGTYDFVLFSTSGTSGATDTSAYTYAFGFRIINPVTTLAISDAGSQWQNPYQSSSSISQTSNTSPYVKYSFTFAGQTGYYDIGAYAVNASAEYEPEVALGIFAGVAPTDAQIADVTTLPVGYVAYFPYDNNDEQGVWVLNVLLTAGSTYTFVASNSEAYTTYIWENLATVGFFIVPTIVVPFNPPGLVSFTTPGHESPPYYPSYALPDCEDYGNGIQPYAVTTFRAVGTIALTLTSESTYNNYLSNEITYADWSSFLYGGVNNTNPVNTCPITGHFVGYRDTGVVQNLNAQSGITDIQTIAVTPYYSTTTIDDTDAAVIFIFAGVNINSIGGTSTPAPATSAPATSTPTTSTPTTSTPTTSTPAPTFVTYAVTINIPNVVGGCSNTSVIAFLNTTADSSTSLTCAVSGNGVVISGTSTVATGTDVNAGLNLLVIALDTVYGLPGATASATVVPTQAPTSTPAPAASTTSSAASVVASVVVVAIAMISLF